MASVPDALHGGAPIEERSQYSAKLSAFELRLNRDHEIEDYEKASNDIVGKDDADQYSVKLSALELRLRHGRETDAVEESNAQRRREIEDYVKAPKDTISKESAAIDERQRRLFDISASASESDIVELNVGGTPMSATRATLLRAGRGSILAAMFSGSWEQRHVRDAQGRIFLDANPYCFDMLLSFLRMKGIEDPAVPTALPNVAEDRRVEFAALVKYYAAPLFEPDRDFEPVASATLPSSRTPPHDGGTC